MRSKMQPRESPWEAGPRIPVLDCAVGFVKALRVTVCPVASLGPKAFEMSRLFLSVSSSVQWSSGGGGGRRPGIEFQAEFEERVFLLPNLAGATAHRHHKPLAGKWCGACANMCVG